MASSKLLLALVMGLVAGCAASEATHQSTNAQSVTDSVSQKPGPSPKQIELTRASGLKYRTLLTLTSDGDAFWDGLRGHPRSGRYTGRIDRATFDELAREVEKAAAEWERLAPSRRNRFGADGTAWRLIVRRSDDSTAELVIWEFWESDADFKPLVKRVESLADRIDWVVTSGDPTK